MARSSVAAQNLALAGVFAATAPTASATSTWVSLHTADPGPTGANEYAGVTRVQFSAGTPTGGVISNTTLIVFATSGSTPVTHVGVWTALTGGTYLLGAILLAPLTATGFSFPVGAINFALNDLSGFDGLNAAAITGGSLDGGAAS